MYNQHEPETKEALKFVGKLSGTRSDSAPNRTHHHPRAFRPTVPWSINCCLILPHTLEDMRPSNSQPLELKPCQAATNFSEFAASFNCL